MGTYLLLFNVNIVEVNFVHGFVVVAKLRDDLNRVCSVRLFRWKLLERGGFGDPVPADVRVNLIEPLVRLCRVVLVLGKNTKKTLSLTFVLYCLQNCSNQWFPTLGRLRPTKQHKAELGNPYQNYTIL